MGTHLCIKWSRKAAVVLTASAMMAMAMLAGCGDSESSEFQEGTIAALESRVAAVETTLAQPTLFPTTVPPTATVEPDRVVGVEWRCLFGLRSEVLQEQRGLSCTVVFSPEWCARDVQPDWDNCLWVQDVVAAVTVRVFDGRTYTVTVQEPNRFIELGQRWPPE